MSSVIMFTETLSLILVKNYLMIHTNNRKSICEERKFLHASLSVLKKNDNGLPTSRELNTTQYHINHTGSHVQQTPLKSRTGFYKFEVIP